MYHSGGKFITLLGQPSKLENDITELYKNKKTHIFNSESGNLHIVIHNTNLFKVVIGYEFIGYANKLNINTDINIISHHSDYYIKLEYDGTNHLNWKFIKEHLDMDKKDIHIYNMPKLGDDLIQFIQNPTRQELEPMEMTQSFFECIKISLDQGLVPKDLKFENITLKDNKFYLIDMMDSIGFFSQHGKLLTTLEIMNSTDSIVGVTGSYHGVKNMLGVLMWTSVNYSQDYRNIIPDIEYRIRTIKQIPFLTFLNDVEYTNMRLAIHLLLNNMTRKTPEHNSTIIEFDSGVNQYIALLLAYWKLDCFRRSLTIHILLLEQLYYQQMEKHDIDKFYRSLLSNCPKLNNLSIQNTKDVKTQIIQIETYINNALSWNHIQPYAKQLFETIVYDSEMLI